MVVKQGRTWEYMMVTKTIEKRLCSSSNGKAKHFQEGVGGGGEKGEGGSDLLESKTKDVQLSAHLYMSLCTCAFSFHFRFQAPKRKKKR